MVKANLLMISTGNTCFCMMRGEYVWLTNMKRSGGRGIYWEEAVFIQYYNQVEFYFVLNAYWAHSTVKAHVFNLHLGCNMILCKRACNQFNHIYGVFSFDSLQTVFSTSLFASWNRRAEFASGSHTHRCAFHSVALEDLASHLSVCASTTSNAGISIETRAEQQMFDEDGRFFRPDAKSTLGSVAQSESHWDVEMFPVPKAENPRSSVVG